MSSKHKTFYYEHALELGFTQNEYTFEQAFSVKAHQSPFENNNQQTLYHGDILLSQSDKKDPYLYVISYSTDPQLMGWIAYRYLKANVPLKDRYPQPLETEFDVHATIDRDQMIYVGSIYTDQHLVSKHYNFKTESEFDFWLFEK